jgi:O-antigen/teichoic acid export membrane protein
VTSSTRVAAIVASVLLAYRHHGVTSIMIATLGTVIVATVLLAVSVRWQIGPVLGWPSWKAREMSEVISFGATSWLLGISGMAFNQLDRLLVGFFLGPAELGYYSVCAQATQPIHGIVASGLHFLFPNVSARVVTDGPSAIGQSVKRALLWNIVLTVVLSIPLTFFSRPFLTLWMGSAFAAHASLLLALLSLAAGLLALNVTLHYSLLAMGCIRYVALLNLLAGAAMLTVMALLIPRLGIVGAGVGRVVYGPVTWLMYFRLNDVVHRSRSAPPQSSSAALTADA